MEYTVETQYTSRTLALMAKALRKTIRKKHSRRMHIVGWLVLALGVLLVIKNFALDMRTLLTIAWSLVLLLVLLFEDRLNGYQAKKRMLPGTERAVTVFSESGFVSTTAVGKSEWTYDKVLLLAEIEHFFVFIYHENHAQLYDWQQLQGGTADDFRRFIEAATGKKIQKL